MVRNEEFLDTLKNMVFEYISTNKEKINDCTPVVAYAYQYVNAHGDNALNIILVYDGWNDILQDEVINGIDMGMVDSFGTDISIYALNINDFNTSDEDSMLLYQDVLILMDKVGLFANLNKENNSYKKVRTMV